MIGLSLSFCIKEVIEGKVDPGDIQKIIAGTKIANRDQFREVMFNNYAPIYWKKNPKQAIILALALWDSGMIEQPRTRGEEHPGIHNGIWI